LWIKNNFWSEVSVVFTCYVRIFTVRNYITMRFVLTTLLTVLMYTVIAQSPEAVKAYVDRYKAIAIEEMKTCGIPASVTLAQGIHESGCGMSVLAQKSNNHFGIKCHEEWTGNKYHHDDDAPQECFRVYNSPEESFRDHSEFLKSRPRYSGLFKLGATDYSSWARGLKSAGYATNPQYPQIIIKLIEDYGLYQYDNGSTAQVQTNTAPTPTKQSDKKTEDVVSLIQQSLSSQASVTTSETKKEIKTLPIEKPKEITQYSFSEKIINGTHAVIFKRDIALSAIAEKYGISMEQLYAYNDITPSIRIKDNENIFVQEKKPESSYYQYEVSEGETMRDVSQKFGLLLSELYKRNGIRPGSEPLSGEVIVLRGKREVALKYRITGRATVETYNPSDNKVHTVETSETLYSISRQYKIPVNELKKANGLKDDDIKVGQTLVVDL